MPGAPGADSVERYSVRYTTVLAAPARVWLPFQAAFHTIPRPETSCRLDLSECKSFTILIARGGGGYPLSFISAFGPPNLLFGDFPLLAVEVLPAGALRSDADQHPTV